MSGRCILVGRLSCIMSFLALLICYRQSAFVMALQSSSLLHQSTTFHSFTTRTTTTRTARRSRYHAAASSPAAPDVPIVKVGDDSLLTDTRLRPSPSSTNTNKRKVAKLIIHWKGEASGGSNQQFRQCEFYGALGAVVDHDDGVKNVESTVHFSNALHYDGLGNKRNDPVMTELRANAFNHAMQYLDIVLDKKDDAIAPLTTQDCIRAVERCSLIHALYEIVAETDNETYDDLAVQTLENGAFYDMTSNNATWCMRLRHYGAKVNETNDSIHKERRYGHRARSMALERQALQALKPLLLTFAGRVDLEHPECKIYVLDGLTRSSKVLARRIATGARRTSPLLDPNTRHCVTTTPLGAVAAYTLVNVARVRPGHRVLDPYAGSATLLLAAALVAASSTNGVVQSVGIEVAHNGIVNRDDIRTDFVTRNLTLPVALIHGDCRDADIRRQAIAAVGNEPFDCIITDPPYGIRESLTGGTIISSSSSSSLGAATRPIDDLLQMMVHDRNHGDVRLLKQGGRLVVFLPQSDEQSLHGDVLPSPAQLDQAGLECEFMREQPLNEKLSRWLVCYKCTR